MDNLTATEVIKLEKQYMKEFVESYRCRIRKIDLTLDNFGGLGENHGIFCKACVINV